MKTYKLVQTCMACPEQYDVFLNDHEIGYLRLRHGTFYAEHDGVEVYRAYPKGDGIFEPDERNQYLTEAVAHIHAASSSLDEFEFSVEYEDF